MAIMVLLWKSTTLGGADGTPAQPAADAFPQHRWSVQHEIGVPAVLETSALVAARQTRFLEVDDLDDLLQQNRVALGFLAIRVVIKMTEAFFLTVEHSISRQAFN